MSNCNFVITESSTVRHHAYWPIAVLPLITWLISVQLSAWAAMWVLTIGVFFAFKWLTLVSLINDSPRALDANHLVGYLVAWPGLDAPAFFAAKAAVAPPSTREWLAALSKTIVGVGLWFGLARPAHALSPYLAGWVGMVGFAFILHFGLFHGLSCCWRSCGINATPIMDWPILARSVSEFWGRRWNRAFRDVAYRFVLRPLRTRYGLTFATLVVFAVSGLIHELVISVPAGSGYGLPTLYFLLQCGAIWFEKSRLGRRWGLAAGMRGRLFALLMVGGAAPLLFHGPFVSRVVLPLLEITGAL